MIILICEKLMENSIDSSEFYFINLFQFVQTERQKRQNGREVLQNKGIGERRALSIFHNISKAVYYMHENDIVHRNLTVSLKRRNSEICGHSSFLITHPPV